MKSTVNDLDKEINRTYNSGKYQGYRERTVIDVIKEQKQNVILEMLWLAYHNSEINWKTEEVKMIRCSEKCGKQ